MISHQILSRALLDYNKTIIRGGRGDKMKEVTRQIAEAVPTNYHTSYVKMQGHDKQKKGSFWGGYGSSELGEVPVLSCKKPRYGKGNHFIKGPIDLRWIQTASQNGTAELALFIWYKRGILGAKASIQIRPKDCSAFGLGDRRRQRQLDRLVEAGLVLANKGAGRCPVVKVIDLPCC